MGNKILESRWAKVCGRLMHYRASTASPNEKISPVVLVHGLGVSSRYMIPTAACLAPRRQVYAPDLPGFGRSQGRGRALNVTELADALFQWLEEVGIPRAVLLGNSIGCQVVVELALRRPLAVERIVLVAPTVDTEARTVFRSFARLLLDVPRERLSLPFIALLDYLQSGLGRTAHTFGYAIQDRVEEKLPFVPHPALVVRGSRDPIVSERWAALVSELLPAGRLALLEGAAHAVNHNSPEELAEIVLDFMKDGD
ncbi:MAG TPA: alpha/beta hydrolase [Pyrinomonadaceae bacterium]|nr:alpha/beta hydrolase [Pyrinomonadaceae bacterium]